MPALQLLIKGKVQGVFYRATACKVALNLGLTGSVRNTSEGHVEVLAAGSDEQLNELLDWCRKGPSRARVEDVEVNTLAEQSFEGFKIIR